VAESSNIHSLYKYNPKWHWVYQICTWCTSTMWTVYRVHHAKRGARTYWYMFENRRKNTPAVAHVFKTLCTISTTQARAQPPNGCPLLLVTSSVGVPLRAGRANILHLSTSPPTRRACAPLRTSDQITLTWH